jgi:diadenosine tetraphosphatase ApaH/serine/threonine PP2A family protein phosphatase
MGDLDLDQVLGTLCQMPPPVIPQPMVLQIVDLSQQLLIQEENLLELHAPIIVVGDIHGQLYDLLEIFRIEPPPPESCYLFLGDYVDRGYYSLEVLLYLLCLKLKYPSQVFLLRGNHESLRVTRTYGFYDELAEKFPDQTVYLRCCDLFNYFPVAATIDERIFAVHGGLAASIHLLDQIHAVDRFQEPVLECPVYDFLWSDPSLSDTFTGFQLSIRGAGYIFGGDVTRKFAAINRLTHITRAHQIAMNGYQLYFEGLISTVWSAPNYMYRSGNLASVMRVSHNDREFSLWFNIFDAVPRNERTVPPGKDVVSPYFL